MNRGFRMAMLWLVLLLPAGVLAQGQGDTALAPGIGQSQQPITSRQAATDDATPSTLSPGVSTGSMLKVLFSLAAVVALIYGLAWLLRRSVWRSAGNAQTIRLLASASVGARERVVLVDIAGQQLLLGVAPGRVDLLKDFEQPIVDAQALPAGDFSALLDRLQGDRTSAQ